MKIAHIVGVRPQFIKYFPISNSIKKNNRDCSGNNIRDILVHTGQHYDYNMSKIFFDKFGIKAPEYHLDVGPGTQGVQTGKIIQKTEEVLLNEKPDVVIVYGDTNTTLGGTLAASKLHIPVVHVEAGLRSFNKSMPEEINRILADHASTFLLCPSKMAVNNLTNEGFKNPFNGGEIIPVGFFAERENAGYFNKGKDNSFVLNIGDVMYDVLLHAIDKAEEQPDILEQLKLVPKSYYLLTLHRAENTENIEKLEEIVGFVNDISEGKDVIFPIHPRTRRIYENTKVKLANNVKIIGPIDYFDMLQLLKESSLVLTDSGGLQKEAYWLEIPCITLRKETEWMETVKSGWNVLYRDYKGPHNSMFKQEAYYGDGEASERVVSIISNYLECI